MKDDLLPLFPVNLSHGPPRTPEEPARMKANVSAHPDTSKLLGYLLLQRMGLVNTSKGSESVTTQTD